MKLIFALLALGMCYVATARQIVKLTGKKELLHVTELKANADGSISYTLDGKRWTAPEFSYDYARVRKPAAISAADRTFQAGNYGKAEKLYQIEYEKYKNLGWGVYCITGRAKALDRAGRLREALLQLERLREYQSPDPALEDHVLAARILYVDLLIKAKRYSEALVLTEALLGSQNNAAVFFAFDRKGDIAQIQKDKKKAVRNYLQAYYLISHHPRKPEVLYKATILLKEMKDKRWKQFANILKKQYPNTGYAKKF